MSLTLNLNSGQVAERKTFITVAEWTEGSNTAVREILGTRTEDSSMEFNHDLETITDVRGITYTDVNKTEPEQTFDPFHIMGGSSLAAYLIQAALENRIAAYTNVFTIYQIAAFSGNSTDGYYTVKHTNCTILPTSIGGDAKVVMPIEIHFSNAITVGTVDKLADDFEFTPTSTPSTGL